MPLPPANFIFAHRPAVVRTFLKEQVDSHRTTILERELIEHRKRSPSVGPILHANNGRVIAVVDETFGPDVKNVIRSQLIDNVRRYSTNFGAPLLIALLSRRVARVGGLQRVREHERLHSRARNARKVRAKYTMFLPE